jgi:hypothetical protein
MRRLFIFLVISLIAGASRLNAQTERGTLMLGGNASFQAADDVSVFVFNPNLGVFVSRNFAIGLGFNLVSSDDISQWSLGPFARYYFGKNEKGKPFGQAALSLGGGTGSDVSVGGGLAAGYAFFLNQSIALEAAISYFRIEDIGLVVIGAGFQIHFKKQK